MEKILQNEGYCERCGSCCKLVGQYVPELDRGDGVCRYLEVEPDGRYACSIYSMRPEVCRIKGRSEAELKKACEFLRSIVAKKELQYAA